MRVTPTTSGVLVFKTVSVCDHDCREIIRALVPRHILLEVITAFLLFRKDGHLGWDAELIRMHVDYERCNVTIFTTTKNVTWS